MSKNSVYSCQNCGSQSPKWSGRCLECSRWGTMKEEAMSARSDNPAKSDLWRKTKTAATLSLAAAQKDAPARRGTGNADIDRVLGGGLVAGEVILLAGEPGVGKSTLLLSLAHTVGGKVLYVAGEESPSQIALRASRLGVEGADIRFLTETDAETAAATLAHEKPSLAIVDSIQTIRAASSEAEAGGTSQVRAAGAILTEAAKSSGVPVILVGQVTKDGAIAGPKTLEHLVDAVLSFEGDTGRGLRILRPEKNRFGATDEVAIFRMTDRGLAAEPNPSTFLLADRRPGESGSAITCFLEGNRPLLVEVQALAAKSAYATPIRRASGYDQNRLLLLLAVLEKRAGLSFTGADVHLNIVGGITLRDPSTDLAVALSLASAATDRPVEPTLVAFGEVGLGGEVRSVGRSDRRVTEAAALGFTRVLAPESTSTAPGLALTAVRTLKEALAKTLGL